MNFADKNTTRREFVKDVALGAVGAAKAGWLSSWPAAAQGTKHARI